MLGTVTKAGKVLDLFTSTSPEWGVGEVAAQLGIPKSSAHGLLSTLCGIGLVRNVAGRYRLGWRIAELNRTLCRTTGLLRGSGIILRQLADQVGATVQLAALRDQNVKVLDRVLGPFEHADDLLGDTRSALDSVCGKVLLAQQSSNEIAFYMDESDDGLWSVAAPIRDADGAVHLALGLTLPADIFRRDTELLGKCVQRAAARISNYDREKLSPPDAFDISERRTARAGTAISVTPGAGLRLHTTVIAGEDRYSHNTRRRCAT